MYAQIKVLKILGGRRIVKKNSADLKEDLRTPAIHPLWNAPLGAQTQ